MNDTTDIAPQVPQKTKVRLLICKSGQCMAAVVPAETETPPKLIMPLNLAGDPRLFLKNGELVAPFVKVEFRHRKNLDVSGVDVHIYGEVASADFDPAGMQPVTVRSLAKDFEELNQKEG